MGTSILGTSVLRTEDPGLLRGTATYVADLPLEHPLRAVFVRSPMAHARIAGVDASEAKAMPGVEGVFTAADLGLPNTWHPGVLPESFGRPILASEVVRFVGEPVAVVVAETQAQALDAAESLMVDYDPLATVVDILEAMVEGAPLLYPEHGSNVIVEFDRAADDVMDGADVVVRARFVNQRLAPVPMETNDVAAAPDPATGGLTVWSSTQIPHGVRDEISDDLGLAPDQVRVIAPAVGGGFGAKGHPYPEHVVVAALALRLGRPVRYTEGRSEGMVAMTHGRAQVQDVELGATGDGMLVGLRVHIMGDMGAYAGQGVYLPMLSQQMATGCYRIPKVAHKLSFVVTNTSPIGPYRGAGRPEAAALIERAVDMLAGELEMDPAELRRRNFIPADGFPYTNAIGTTYDVGDYERSLDEALRLSRYEDLRREQAERRARGDVRQLGIGLSAYVEITAMGALYEFGSVEVHPDASATVKSGISSHGQGHQTMLAQIASAVLDLPMERITVVLSDTGLVPKGEGTSGSRSLQLGGTGIYRASEQVVEKARKIAAHLLEVAKEDVVRTDEGRFGIAGAPDRALTWAELAQAASDPSRLPEGLEPGLSHGGRFAQKDNTFPFGAHVAVVEVDTETGHVRLLRQVAVDDCGTVLNPMLAEGQVHGGLAQGIAQALFEEMRYDEWGNPLTGSLMSYEMPSAADLPVFENNHTETPTPLNPLGAKGIGESATIGSTPAVQNAVIDALSPFGVRHLDMPLTPERVWRAIHGRDPGADLSSARRPGLSWVRSTLRRP